MSDQDQREFLRQQAGKAMARSVEREARLRQRASSSPQPGDIFLLGDAADSPVEWVVLNQDPDDDRRFFAVAVDTNPMAGSSDLALRDASVGPLTLRLKFGVSLAAGTFDPALRRGVLEPASLELARQKWEEVASGDSGASIRQREVDVDPAYEDWIQEVVDPARVALVEPAGVALMAQDQQVATTVVPFPDRADLERMELDKRSVSVRQFYGLAAVSALAVVGFSIWIGIQRSQIGLLTDQFSRELTVHREEIDRLSRPSLDVLDKEIILNDRQRIIEPILIPQQTSHLLLYLVVQEREPCESYSVELRRAGEPVLESGLVDRGNEFRLMLPRAFLSGEPLTIRLDGFCGGQHKLLEERELFIESR